MRRWTVGAICCSTARRGAEDALRHERQDGTRRSSSDDRAQNAVEILGIRAFSCPETWIC